MSGPTAAEMKKCFDKIDVDGGGTLSLQEVAQAMEMMQVEISPADLARSFARADEDNEGELDLQEFTHLVQSLEHGPVEPTPTDRRSEAAVALRKRRHRHATSSQRLDTTSFRHRWTSAEDARRAPRRTADRAVHRASWARQPEDWGGLRAGFEGTLVEPWDDKLDLPEWQRDMKPPAWLRRAKQKLSGAEERRFNVKSRLRAISTQAVTLQRESDHTIAEKPPAAYELQQDHDRHYIENDNNTSLADASFSQLRRNHAEQLRRIDTAQSVEHFLYYLPADQAARFGHLHDQLIESRPSTAGDQCDRPARLSALSVASRRSGSRSSSSRRSRSRCGARSLGNTSAERIAPLSFSRLRSSALEGSVVTTDSDANDLAKWGGWADDIHADRDQELQRARKATEQKRAAAVAHEQAAQHAGVMADLQAAIKALREAQLTIERYRKALGKRVGWQALLVSLRQQSSPSPDPVAEPGPEPTFGQKTQSAESEDDAKQEAVDEQEADEDNGDESLVEQAARRARLVRRRKLAARASMQAIKRGEQQVAARATAARAEFLRGKTALAFAKRNADLERRRATRVAAGIEQAHSIICDKDKSIQRSPVSMRQLEKTIQEAGTCLALEEYSLLTLKDEQAKLQKLLHEVDATLPLTTRRSGLSQAKPSANEAESGSPSAVDAPYLLDHEDQADPQEDQATLLCKAEVAANQLELLGQRVSQCRNAALRSLAARLRQTEEELALRKASGEYANDNKFHEQMWVNNCED